MVCYPSQRHPHAKVGPNLLDYYVVGPEDVNSGTNKDGKQCRNNPKCADTKDLGPITPGRYKMNFDVRPEHQGWNMYQLEPLPNDWIHHKGRGLRYDLAKHGIGSYRGGFEFHVGSITYGCINVEKTNPKAVDQYRALFMLLQMEDGDNFLTVLP